jgi:ZIP family zinc transporter
MREESNYPHVSNSTIRLRIIDGIILHRRGKKTDDFMIILLYSAIAGICGMGLGGFLSAVMIKKQESNITCYLMMFAGGVMTSIVCFGLIPESITLTNVPVSIVGLIIGVIVILFLNRLVDKITATKGDNPNLHQTPEELYHESQIINMAQNPARMLRSGTLMLIAISLHNIPEGIAIGAGGSHDERLGVVLAVMIALHNIPEGMAIAAPLVARGVKRPKVVGLTLLSGATTLIGAIVGIFIGAVSEFALAMSLSVAGGAMLYVVFGEMIPQSVVMTKSRMTSIVLLFGIVVGLIIAHI